jgi:hypothetical protein
VAQNHAIGASIAPVDMTQRTVLAFAMMARMPVSHNPVPVTGASGAVTATMDKE